MAASSTEPSAQGPTRRLGLLYATLACLIAVAGAAWWPWRYAPLPDPFEPAEAQTFWQWLTTPIERNAFRRLPVITGDLNGVFAVKGTDHVWAVGERLDRPQRRRRGELGAAGGHRLEPGGAE